MICDLFVHLGAPKRNSLWINGGMYRPLLAFCEQSLTWLAMGGRNTFNYRTASRATKAKSVKVIQPEQWSISGI